MQPQNNFQSNPNFTAGSVPTPGFQPQFQQSYQQTPINAEQPIQSFPAQPQPYQQLPGMNYSQPNALPPTPVPGQATQPGQPQPGQPQAINSANQHATPDHPLATQTMLQISELRDNLVIMKDGSFRAVVACQSINFDLMSNAEREGIEYSYQNFLNSLTFTTQILIRNQRVDIGPYIEYLSELRRNSDNMLLGVLMDDYINFIDILSQEADIMDTSFFVVVPYYSSPDLEKSVQDTKNFIKTFTRAKAPAITKIDRNTYETAITEINNRVDTVVAGLNQIGVRSVRLNTRKLGELFYNFNNPDTAIREPLVDFSRLASIYVKKGM